jgi:hypothetical protein
MDIFVLSGRIFFVSNTINRRFLFDFSFAAFRARTSSNEKKSDRSYFSQCGIFFKAHYFPLFIARLKNSWQEPTPKPRK